MRSQGLLVIELLGHLPTILISCIAMAFAGYVSGFLEAASVHCGGGIGRSVAGACALGHPGPDGPAPGDLRRPRDVRAHRRQR